MNKILLITLFTITSSYAASFDCNKASTEIENTICSSYAVNILDEKLAQLYKLLKNNLKENAKNSFINNQKEWLKKRNQNCHLKIDSKIKNCLISTYEERINYFQEVKRIISKDALKLYYTGYKEAENHKAFAQSEGGAWAWRKNKTTKEHAIKAALIGCQFHNKKHEEEYPCKIIYVDGSWMNPS